MVRSVVHERDTIFALSSGKPPSGVAVIRVSGPDAFPSCAILAGAVTPERRAVMRTLRTADGAVLDHALVITFKGPASFTGEDTVEYHVHGGPAVVAAVLAALAACKDHRLAEAGEFSRRAFLNGKAGLSELEALADLVSAETEAQRRLAVGQASGRNSALYAQWRSSLLRCRAMLEADLDFSDEEDVPGSVSEAVFAEIAMLAEAIAAHAATMRRGEIIRDGLRVVLAGAPNAGKSSLFNALAGRDVAIVTPVPGTTRDVLDVVLDLDGYKVIVSDTAGLRHSSDLVEQIGIDRARAAMRSAHVVLWLAEGGRFGEGQPETDALVLRVATKRDVATAEDDRSISVSALTGEGVDTLCAEIGRVAAEMAGADGETAIVSRQRQFGLLMSAADELRAAHAARGAGLEFAADHIRRASDYLGRITGHIDAEDVLGTIFAAFCIGK